MSLQDFIPIHLIDISVWAEVVDHPLISAAGVIKVSNRVLHFDAVPHFFSCRCLCATFFETLSQRALCKISSLLHLADAAHPGGRTGKDGKGQSPPRTHMNSHLRCFATLQADRFCLQLTSLMPQRPAP